MHISQIHYLPLAPGFFSILVALFIGMVLIFAVLGVLISSMKTRRSEFSSLWLARHSSRAWATSERSCSAARSDFF